MSVLWVADMSGRTCLDSDARVVHVASDVGEDLGSQTELADSLAIATGLLGGGGRSELDVLDTERITRLRNSDLGLGIEEGVRELLAL